MSNDVVTIIDTSAASNHTGGEVYTSPGGEYIKTLAFKSQWKFIGTQVVNKRIWFNLGGNQWISDEFAGSGIKSVDNTSGTAKVADFGMATVYNSPNGLANGQTLSVGTEWKYNKVAIDDQNIKWFNAGHSQWITTREVLDITPGRRVSVTFYDPKNLGSTLGYDGVAANLNVYPKGTRLRIELDKPVQGVYSLIRTVNDTGYFVGDNPNQIDIAIPSADIPSYGVTNATVYVI